MCVSVDHQDATESMQIVLKLRIRNETSKARLISKHYRELITCVCVEIKSIEIEMPELTIDLLVVVPFDVLV